MLPEIGVDVESIVSQLIVELGTVAMFAVAGVLAFWGVRLALRWSRAMFEMELDRALRIDSMDWTDEEEDAYQAKWWWQTKY